MDVNGIDQICNVIAGKSLTNNIEIACYSGVQLDEQFLVDQVPASKAG